MVDKEREKKGSQLLVRFVPGVFVRPQCWVQAIGAERKSRSQAARRDALVCVGTSPQTKITQFISQEFRLANGSVVPIPHST